MNSFKLDQTAFKIRVENLTKLFLETNDQQLLLNLIKRRYGDSISVLEVSSVSTSVEWQRGGSVALTIFDGGPDANNAGIGGAARYTEKPTITYLPL